MLGCTCYPLETNALTSTVLVPTSANSLLKMSIEERLVEKKVGTRPVSVSNATNESTVKQLAGVTETVGAVRESVAPDARS